MKKIGEFKIFGTAKAKKESIELDEISIIANPKELSDIGVFLINAAYEMQMNDLEHLQLQDVISNFSYEKQVDVITLNKKKIKFLSGK